MKWPCMFAKGFLEAEIWLKNEKEIQLEEFFRSAQKSIGLLSFEKI